MERDGSGPPLITSSIESKSNLLKLAQSTTVGVLITSAHKAEGFDRPVLQQIKA